MTGSCTQQVVLDFWIGRLHYDHVDVAFIREFHDLAMHRSGPDSGFKFDAFCWVIFNKLLQLLAPISNRVANVQVSLHFWRNCHHEKPRFSAFSHCDCFFVGAVIQPHVTKVYRA